MEINDLLRWMDATREEAVGRPYAASSLDSTRSRLHTAMEGLGTSELGVLADILPHKDKVTGLYSKLYTGHERSTVQQVHNALKHLHAFSIAKGLYDDVPYPASSPKRQPGKRQPTYTDEQVERIVTLARGKSMRWWMLLATVSHTGRRIQELLDLKWDDLMFAADDDVYFDLHAMKVGRDQNVPLDSFLRETVFTKENIDVVRSQPRGRTARDGKVYIFPWTYEAAQKHLERYCGQIDVPYYGFHRFRHTFATRLMPKIGLVAVSRLLGHARVDTTARIYDKTTGRDYRHLLD